MFFVVKIRYLQSVQTGLLLDINQRRRSTHIQCNHPRDLAGDHQDGSVDLGVPAPQPGLERDPHWPSLLSPDGLSLIWFCPLGESYLAFKILFTVESYAV